MVKFSKQFQAQLVPEWKDAFVDYCQLKKELKKIQFFNSNNTPSKQPQNDSFPSAFLSCIGKVSMLGQKQSDRRTIQVHRKLASSLSKEDLYQTELPEQFSDIEAAGEFFECLDRQLNKVNQFYKIKEKEFSERGESLKKQLEFLIELKNELRRQRDDKEASSLDPKDDPSISCYISCEVESNGIAEETGEEQGQDGAADEPEKNVNPLTELSKPNEMERLSRRITRDDSGSRSFSSRVFS